MPKATWPARKLGNVCYESSAFQILHWQPIRPILLSTPYLFRTLPPSKSLSFYGVVLYLAPIRESGRLAAAVLFEGGFGNKCTSRETLGAL
jgi:hypothetical protein